MAECLPTGTVTFLFTDVEGSTRLLRELGDRYASLLSDHRRVLREAFARNGGVEVDTQGDAFFVAFARAADALAAAREGQERLASGQIRARMGIHTGEPLVTEEGYVGLDVHRAARIAAVGHGGQVLVSEATRQLVGDGDLRELGEHRLKDLTAPERLYQLGHENFPPLRSLNRSNLPLAATPLLGRERELAELLALLQDGNRLVTVTGTGGTGKTRLALQAAAELIDAFPGGVFFVALAPLTDPELVLAAAAQAAGVQDADELQEREALLVLDNLEHLLAAAPALAGLLTRSPQLKLLVTSRAPLRVGGEVEFPLEPLRDDEAAAFFLDRARRGGRHLEAGATVAAICRRLDNLPLALELAAARTRLLDPAALLDRLERRLPLLTHGARDAPERQRTLRGTIEWSYSLLDDPARVLFAKLGVFAGSFSLDAAEKVCDAQLEPLEALVESSLLKPVGGKTRFLLLETIREYALERVEATDERDLHEKHGGHYLALAEAAEPHMRKAGEAAWLERLEADYPNLRQALQWYREQGRSQEAARFGAALGDFWLKRGFVGEGRLALEPLLEFDLQPLLRARVLRAASLVAYRQGAYYQMRCWETERLEIGRAAGDDFVVASSLNGLGLAAMAARDDDEAQRLLERCLAVARRAGLRELVSYPVVNLSILASKRGDHERARELLAEAHSIEEDEDDAAGIGIVLQHLGAVALAAGEHDAASAHLRESLRQFARAGTHMDVAPALLELGCALARTDPAHAARLLGGAEALREQTSQALDPVDAEFQERALARIRAALGEDALGRAWQQGRRLTFEEILREAAG